MPTVSNCPGLAAWQRLLNGGMPAAEAAALAGHLTGCPRCAAALRTLRDEETVSASLLAAVTQPPAPEGWPASADAGGEPTACLEPAQRYPFLAAPRAPGELGGLGPYRVLNVLGKGGMGVVFLAEDPQLQRWVALKALLPALASNPSARERFLREARAAAAIEHDHIVHIYEVGEDRGVPYLAMALLRGEALDALLKRESRLPVAAVLRIGRETALGLAAAHERGLIHRDVKPGNLWLEEREPAPTDAPGPPGPAPGPRVKILDFGLVRVTTDDDALSQFGLVVGTPGYIAPEQARAGAIDARCDLFSLGCVLYRMATGARPFRGADLMSTLAALATDTPAPPRDLNPALPAALSDLVMRLLAKDPTERPPSARAVVALLAAIEQEEDAVAPADRHDPCPTMPRERISAAPWPRARRWGCMIVLVLLPAAGLAAYTTGPALLRIAADRGWLMTATDAPDLPMGAEPELPSIDELLRRLGDEDVAVREQAAVRLASIGAPALAALKQAAAKSANRDVKQRSTALVARIEKDLRGELLTISGQRGYWLNRVAFCGGGKHAIASGGAVIWYDLATGKEVRRVLERHGARSGLALSPDGRWFATGHQSDRDVRLGSVADGQAAGTCRGHTAGIWAVAFAPDGGRLVSSSDDKTLRLWDVPAGTAVRTIDHGPYPARAIAFAPDGRFIASGTIGDRDLNRVYLWETASGQKIRTFDGHRDGVAAIRFTPDGQRLLSAGYDGMLVVWDVATAQELKRLKHGTGGAIYDVAISPDGRRALTAGFGDRVVRLWDLERGEEIQRFEGHPGAVLSVAFSPDGKRALSSDAQCTVKLWKLP